MKLTKRHAIIGILLGAALIAVLVDRMLSQDEGTGPRRAAASPPRTTGAAQSAAHKPPAPLAEPPAAQVAIAARLDTLRQSMAGQTDRRRDAFQLVEPWRSELIVDAGERAVAGSVKPEQEFVRKHRLTSVLVAGPQGMVVVDDKTLRIGESLDGACLVQVTPEKAVFDSGHWRVELKFGPQPAPGTGR